MSTQPEQETQGPTPAIDLDLCELDAFRVALAASSSENLAYLADICPRRIPHKARGDRDRLISMLLVRWTWPDARAVFVRECLHALPAIGRFRTAGLDSVLESIEDHLPVTAAVWFATQAGIPPEDILNALPLARRDDLRANLEERLPHLHAALLAERERRQAQAASSIDAAARARAQRLTKAFRWEAARAQEKLERTQHAAESVVQQRSAEVRHLQRQLREAQTEIARLRQEVAATRDQLVEVARAQAERTGRLSTRIRELAARKGLHLPLAGEDVLVIGDENRKVEYRSIIEELGGAFSFLSGFGHPDRVDSGGHSLIILVTAYASHVVFDHVQAAQAAGTQVILVPQAGAQSFRHAVLSRVASTMV